MGSQAGGGENRERTKVNQEGSGNGSVQRLQAWAPESGSLGSNPASDWLCGFGQVAECL